jgi:predicted metal-dependent phosphoesterase TrpH
MRIDCHCHTVYSKHFLWGYDALDTPLDMIKAAMKKGIDGLAITDHNSVKGGLVGKSAAKRFKKFTVIVGSEVRTIEGEIIALDVKENIPTKLTIEETVEKIHDLGGIAVAPHPFGNYVFRKCAGKKSLLTDAIEVYNSTLTGGQNKKALSLATVFKKPVTAGSDSHSYREVGSAGIIVEGDPIESILKRRVKVFGRGIPIWEIANRATRKFARSFEWRINGRRGRHIKKISV